MVADGDDEDVAGLPGPVERLVPRLGWKPLVGLMLAGYGLLVLAGVLPHDAPVAGAASLMAGAVLLAAGLPAVFRPRRSIVALLGCACIGGVAGYALARGSGLSAPELAIVAYGMLLLVAAPRLDARLGRFQVGSLVGWSFPLLLAPLSLFALNAGLSSPQAGSAAGPLVQAMVVDPTAALLRLLGTPVHQAGSTLVLATPRGTTMSLGIGLVCAGLYPGVLFGGLVALHAWHDRVPLRRAALLVLGGLAGLWLLNVVRLVLLTRIGLAYGMDALQAAHANLGWLFFSAFMVVFWRFALAPAHAPTSPSVTPGR